MTTDTTMSERILTHHRAQFGSVSLHQIISKLLEECGEVAGNVTRSTECRPGTDWEELIRNEIGDVLIVLTALAGQFGWDIEDIYDDASVQFLERTWDIKRGRT